VKSPLGWSWMRHACERREENDWFLEVRNSRACGQALGIAEVHMVHFYYFMQSLIV
jgi:hypothetical protein